MNNYMPIEKALPRLQKEFNWFHSFIRELYFTTLHCNQKMQDISVDNGIGETWFPRDLRMVVASAGNPKIFGIEFICYGIQSFSLQRLDELLFACEIEKERVQLNFTDAKMGGGPCWIISNEVQVAFLGEEYLGPFLRIGHELPRVEAIGATMIDECWRQCTNCSNAWKESPNVCYSRCPDCGQLTKLQG